MELTIHEKPIQQPIDLGDGYNNTCKPFAAYKVVEYTDDTILQADMHDIIICFAPGFYLNATKQKIMCISSRDKLRGIKVVRAFHIQSIVLVSDTTDRPT